MQHTTRVSLRHLFDLSDPLFSTLLLSVLLLLTSGLSPAANAAPVSGAIYDVDFLRAQLGGFRGVKYPRYTDQNGADVSQMIYAYNGNIADTYHDYAFVMDITTGAVATAQPVRDSKNNAIPGQYTYAFPDLSPGRHDLMFIEPYRCEVYKPSSKRVAVTVPTGTTPITATDINLLWQWRLAGVIATAPIQKSTVPISSISVDYVTKSLGFVAMSTNNGMNNGWGPGRYAIDVYRTTNAGKIWTKLAHIPAPLVNNYGIADVGTMILPQYGLHFTDSMHGVLLAEVNWNFYFWGNGLLVLNTTDGGKTWTPDLSSTDYRANSTPTANDVLWVNDYYNGFTHEAAWNPANRPNGVMYGVLGDNTGRVFTRVSKDRGKTWRPDHALLNAPDVGASAGGWQRFFVYANGSFSAHSDAGGGLTLTTGATAWKALQDQDGHPLTPAPGAYIAGRASGQSAIAYMNAADGYHLYRTDDGGKDWNRLRFYNGGDGYGGSLIHSYTFLSPIISLLSADDALLWSPSQADWMGRSVDGCLSRSYMGALGLLPNYSATPTGAVDASPDIHTGRRVLLMDPAYYGTTLITASALSFTFDEETPVSPAHIVPLLTAQGYHYNAAPGLYVNMVNTGGDWARDITFTGITATNGAQLSFPALPWNIGAIPPGSTTNQAYDYADPGEIYFTFTALPPAGTAFTVTVTGTYSSGQTFSVTLNLKS